MARLMHIIIGRAYVRNRSCILQMASDLGATLPARLQRASSALCCKFVITSTDVLHCVQVSMGMSCMLGLAVSHSTFVCTRVNDPLMTSTAGNLKNIVMTIIGAFAFGDFQFSLWNSVGLLMSMVGAIWYAARSALKVGIAHTSSLGLLRLQMCTTVSVDIDVVYVVMRLSLAHGSCVAVMGCSVGARTFSLTVHVTNALDHQLCYITTKHD